LGVAHSVSPALADDSLAAGRAKLYALGIIVGVTFCGAHIAGT